MLGLDWVVIVFALPRSQPSQNCLPSWHFKTVPLATCQHIAVQLRNLVLRGERGVLPSCLPRPGAFASRSECNPPNLPNARASALPAARHRPNPPMFIGTPAALLASADSPAMPTKWQKHCHNASSWASANSSDKRGLTIRRWKLAQGTAQYNSKSQALGRSLTAGILWNKVWLPRNATGFSRTRRCQWVNPTL